MTIKRTLSCKRIHECRSHVLLFVQMLCKFGYTCLALLAAGFCFMVSGTGLVLGPLCLHNGTEGLEWERPLKQVKHG